ncbi:MAG: 30S ribosomal protein S9 [Candidatus Neomarinimicrobiota bacterium]|nr:30S ribosomal protein S9 [Candidatus Neomarinimicrobiota bacterium]|tara:strand:+ start:495 stop:887 length:393 start_codon:yes stop_codon:yes gene_type:complete
MSESKFYGTGRRKSSTARVFLAPGKGEITVNGLPFKEYLCRDTLATIVMQPLVATESIKSFRIKINVNGGGLTGQAGAIRLGIAKALLQVNKDFRPILKSKGFLTRDARKVERKKPGQPGARANFQFSKR